MSDFEPRERLTVHNAKTDPSRIEKVDYPYGIYNTRTPFLLFRSFNEIVVSIIGITRLASGLDKYLYQPPYQA